MLYRINYITTNRKSKVKFFRDVEGAVPYET